MKYYKELAERECFTRAYVEELTGNAETASSLLQWYQKNDYIKLVKRNLYVTISMETGQTLPNRYRIASSITDGSYISHHSAFEYYGLANQVFYEVYVSGGKRFNSFEYDGVIYRYIAPRVKFGVVENSDGIRVTDIERTVIDGINNFEKNSGLEELLRCIELIPYINEEQLYDYLKRYDKQFLFQKTGYILNHFRKELRLSDRFFEVCESKINKSVRYLYNGLEYEKNIFDNRWQLVVPENLLKVLSQGSEIDNDL